MQTQIRFAVIRFLQKMKCFPSIQQKSLLSLMITLVFLIGFTTKICMYLFRKVCLVLGLILGNKKREILIWNVMFRMWDGGDLLAMNLQRQSIYIGPGVGSVDLSFVIDVGVIEARVFVSIA